MYALCVDVFIYIYVSIYLFEIDMKI
jgi:hypothetical protein